jgi:putative ABC transport system permease protein
MGMKSGDPRPSEKLDTMHVRYFFDNRTTTYNGCISDFRILDSDGSDGLCAMVYLDDAGNYSTLSVKVSGDEAYAYREVCKLYRETFHQDLNMEHPYMRDQIRANYSRQIRISTLMSAFALVAMIIAFLGLMSMSSYFMQQKRREMAIRKVFGSKSAQINLRLLKIFALYVEAG